MQDARAVAELAYRDRGEARAKYYAFDKAFDELATPLEEITKGLEKRALEVQALGDAADETARSGLLVVLAVAGVVLITVSIVISRGITSRLASAVAAADRIARGDLSDDVVVDGSDEIAALQASMRAMNEKLGEVIGEVRAGADALTAASQQVSATSQSLSQGTGEQAASVEETTSSLEEMSASITQNADNSRQTEQMASRLGAERRRERPRGAGDGGAMRQSRRRSRSSRRSRTRRTSSR